MSAPATLATLDEWITYFDATPREDPIQGLLHPATTLITGLPEAGKSALAVNMARALVHCQPLLGQPTDGRMHVVAFVSTDPGGTAEASKRLQSLGVAPPSSLRMHLNPAPRINDDEAWDCLTRRLSDVGCTVLFHDNLSGSLGGDQDSRNSASVAPVLGRLTDLTEIGIAVVLLAHSPKQGVGASGSVITTGWARREINLTTHGSVRDADVHGNDLIGHRKHRFTIAPDCSVGQARDIPPRLSVREARRRTVDDLTMGITDLGEAAAALVAAETHVSVEAARKFLKRNWPDKWQDT